MKMNYPSCIRCKYYKLLNPNSTSNPPRPNEEICQRFYWLDEKANPPLIRIEFHPILISRSYYCGKAGHFFEKQDSMIKIFKNKIMTNYQAWIEEQDDLKAKLSTNENIDDLFDQYDPNGYKYWVKYIFLASGISAVMFYYN